MNNIITNRANEILKSSNILTLYHGSRRVVEKPMYGKGKSDNDYGSGFYLTKNKNLASEWAALYGSDNSCYLNEYRIDISNLNILELDDNDVISWVALLYSNRGAGDNFRVRQDYDLWLKSKIRKDLDKYDCVIGTRADDSYYKFVQYFLLNRFTDKQVKRMLVAGDLGKQFTLISKKSFDNINFIGSEELDYGYWIKLAKKRDKLARQMLDVVEMDSYSANTGKLLRDYILNK